MSRNKLKREKTHKSILAQFFILLVGLGLLCGALFLVLHTTVGSALESYVYSSDFLSNVTEKRVNDLQEYVTENQVSATDSQALSQWMRGKPLTLMEIYRSNVLVYSSYASYSLAVEGGDFTWTATEGEETPTYDWISYYTVDFADGQGEVVLYSNELYRYSTYATMVEIILCAALFLLGFLIAFQRTVSYMRQISLEIQAMEGGDLNRPITVRGDNDLTALAESLDAMRLAFRAQQEREASTYAANQALISQMSHDLRTPLTTLLIYTEILRYGKYQGEEQLRGYLDKIDGKAQQIKQLAENLLEYSLASQKRAVEMEPPRPGRGGLWSPAAGDSHLPGAVRLHLPVGAALRPGESGGAHPLPAPHFGQPLLQHFKIRQPQGAYPGAGPRRGKHAGAVFPQQPKGTGRRH